MAGVAGSQALSGKGVLQFLALLVLFNGLIFYDAFFTVLCSSESLVFSDVLVGDWKIAQFLSAYQREFMKRGLVATGFAALGVQVSYQSIVIFTGITINLFFLVFYFYVKKLFHRRAAWFLPFMLVFIFSPGTALQMGADYARFDQINLLLTLVALMALLSAEGERGGVALARVLLVATILVAGMLIHEAYLFIFAPIIMALCYQRVAAGRMPRYALPVCAAAILGALFAIIKFGFAEPAVIQSMSASMQAIAPDYDTQLTLRVWDRRLVESLAYTISLYFKLKYLVQVLVLSLPIGLYAFWLYRLAYTPGLSREYLLVLLSPAAIAPMYIIGCDFPRWSGMVVVLLFLVFVIMLHDDKVRLPDKKYLSAKTIVPILAVGLLVGPVGVSEVFPDRWRVLEHARCLLGTLFG